MQSSNTPQTEPASEPRGNLASSFSSVPKRTQVIAGGLITVAVTLLFFSFYWNRFAGLRSGNGSFSFGMTLVRGLMPYRDFFVSGPPVNAFVSWGVLSIFGEKLVAIRAFGVFERLVLVLLLYCWLVRLFRPTHAMFAAIAAVIVSAGDLSDTLSSYNFEAILFFMLAGFAAVLAFERLSTNVQLGVLAVLSGMCAALSFGTKQTLGLGATVAIPLMGVIYLLRTAKPSKAIIFLVSYAIGWLAVCGAIVLWLEHLGALQEAINDVFRKGPAAKASNPSDFAVRAFRATGHLWWQFLLGGSSFFLAWPALRKSGEEHAKAERPAGLISVAALCTVSILLGAFVSYAGKSLFGEFNNFTIFFADLGITVLLIFYAAKLLRGTLTERESQLCFLTGVSFSVVFMLGLSWPVLFGMIYPALGLVVAILLDQSGQRGRYIVYAVGALVFLSLTCDKLNHPQGFHEYSELPVRFANTRSTLPELQGMLLPPTTVRFVDETVRIVKEHSTAHDTIFVYPELGIFYDLTKLRAPTLTMSHNIDVVSDDFARSEAERLIAGRPAVLVYYRQPAWALRSDEKQWRGGKPSGQRDLVAACETLAREYDLAGSFNVPPNEFPVDVYVRR